MDLLLEQERSTLSKLAHLLQVKNKSSLVFAFCSVVKIGLGRPQQSFPGAIFLYFLCLMIFFFSFIRNISVCCLNVLCKSKT